MRHKTAFSRRAAAFLLALLLAAPVVYADAGERKLQTSMEIVDGLTYRNTVTVNGGSRVESFALELAPDSSARAILLQGNETIYGPGNIDTAVSNAQSRGYRVLGAINTDFFDMSTGVPIGIVVEDGVFKTDTEGENVLTFTDGRAEILDLPRVNIKLQNQATGWSMSPQYFNKYRNEIGGVYLLNHYFSGVSTRAEGSGWYVRMKAVSDPATGRAPELTVNSTLTLQVTELILSDKPIAIGKDEYILTADDRSNRGDAFARFQVGDTVTLTTSCGDPVLSSAQWACGVGDVMVRSGALTDSGSWVYAGDGRQPRSALGIKADGTVLLYAVDGRQAGYSVGLSQMDLALELQRQGCVTAVNLDGGGSTAMSLWIPGQSGPVLQSKPSGGRPRGCATYLMLVTDQKGSGTARRLAPLENGLAVLAGSSLVLPQAAAVDEGLNVLSTGLTGLTYTSTAGLGTISGSSYTAGYVPGTDTVTMTSGELSGSLQVHVVDQLTDLTVTKEGSGGSLTELTLQPGERVQLAVSGSYWGREALRDFGAVTAEVQGDVGTVNGGGLFTASQTGGSGSVTLSAGGIGRTISVTVAGGTDDKHVHQDVTPDHWSYEAVEYCYEKGICKGVSDTLFGRDNSIKRADFVVMLHNAMGKPAAEKQTSFGDVPQNAYYAPAVAWAQEQGLASGVNESSFAPTANITREQAFTLLYRFLPLAGKDCDDGGEAYLTQFSDQDSVSPYARTPAATLAAYGLASGSGGRLRPKETLTRAQMAVLLYRVLELDPSTGQRPAPDPAEDSALSLDRSSVTLASGGSATLKAALLPAVESASFTWTSSDPSAASVSSSGVVTNLYTGEKSKTVTITVHWKDQTAQCSVTCQPAEHVGTVINVESSLNVRSGPGTANSKIGSLRGGAQVVVLGQEDGWYQILFLDPNDRAAIGYVSADYMELTR